MAAAAKDAAKIDMRRQVVQGQLDMVTKMNEKAAKDERDIEVTPAPRFLTTFLDGRFLTTFLDDLLADVFSQRPFPDDFSQRPLPASRS